MKGLGFIIVFQDVIEAVLLWHSTLRILSCYCSSSGCCYGMGLIPGLGTSACHGWGLNKLINKTNTENKEKEGRNKIVKKKKKEEEVK